jgi:hypothetical protein
MNHAYPVVTQGAEMLTADTITEAQIRELRDEQRREGHQLNAEICDTALGHLRGTRGQVVSFIGDEIKQARAICAKILNARVVR